MPVNNYKEFYEMIDRDKLYTTVNEPEEHSAHKDLKQFIARFNLYDKKCLEIGSSKGLFQNMVVDYTGLDIVPSLLQHYKKPYFIVNSDGTYPFADNTFDAIWSWAVHEHVPDLNQALVELNRVLKPGGVVFFAPAWQCRPWAAEGHAARPYRDFGLKGKLVKALIPLRDSVGWRSLFIFPKRIYRHLSFIVGKRYKKIIYKKLKPNYNRYWTSDSDACNSIDPHDAILWFESNGFKCLSHPMNIRSFLVRNGILIFEKICYFFPDLELVKPREAGHGEAPHPGERHRPFR
jgi:SAM-dependent methyltransferase